MTQFGNAKPMWAAINMISERGSGSDVTGSSERDKNKSFSPLGGIRAILARLSNFTAVLDLILDKWCDFQSLVRLKMSRLIRFFSRRRYGRGVQRAEEQSPEKPRKNVLQCKVILLDDSSINVDLPVSVLFCISNPNSVLDHDRSSASVLSLAAAPWCFCNRKLS